MNTRIILVIFLFVAIATHGLSADYPSGSENEIERFQLLEAAMQSAFRDHIARRQTNNEGPLSTGGYGDFMHARINPVFAEIYGDAFSGTDLDSLPNGDLKARFKAFSIGGFFHHSDSIVAHMIKIVDTLDRRGEVTQEIAGRMFGYLIRSRDFDAARAFHSRFSEMHLEPVPKIITSVSKQTSNERKTVWEVATDGTSLIQVELQFKGPQIVVFASLTCAHSRRFMAELPDQAKLAEIFGQHAVWIEPQDNDLHMQAVAAWNRQHPDQALQFMHSFSEWPEYTEWATPAFYFLDDGQIVKSLTGWPNWEGIIDGVEKIGLVAEDEIQPPDQPAGG